MQTIVITSLHISKPGCFSNLLKGFKHIFFGKRKFVGVILCETGAIAIFAILLVLFFLQKKQPLEYILSKVLQAYN